MRRKVIAGNWKMNMTPSQAVKLVTELRPNVNNPDVDIAGSLAKYAAKLGDEVTLFTSDKDFLQLLDDNIVVKFLRKGLSEIELFTKDNIYEKLGFRADQVTDYKGLVGDTSDNFKGIPGIGEKTAEGGLTR